MAAGRRSWSRLLDACQRANIDAVLSDRIDVDIWSKFARLTVFSGLTSVARLPLGPLRQEPEIPALMQAALQESVAVGRAIGVPLPDSLVADIMASMMTMPPGSKSSMLEDLEHGRRLELPWLSGTMARLGKEVGVPTPIHAFIATVLAPHVNGTPRTAPGSGLLGGSGSGLRAQGFRRYRTPLRRVNPLISVTRDAVGVADVRRR